MDKPTVANKLNLYWTDRQDAKLLALYEIMKERGFEAEFGGKPNYRAVIEYALDIAIKDAKKSQGSRKQKPEQGDNDG